MSLHRKGNKSTRRSSSSGTSKKNRSDIWVKHGPFDQPPINEGDLIRRHIGMEKFEYGIASGGFGLNTQTIGGAIFVKPAKGVEGSITEPERWNRDNDVIQRKDKAAVKAELKRDRERLARLRKQHVKKESKPQRQRKFKIGYMTRVFDDAGRFSSKTDASDAAKKLGPRYYTRITRVKVRDYEHPKPYQLWKCKKPEWK